MTAQRIRITFARGEPLRFISHLDLMRFWERAFRRAGIDVARSEGFTPHPRISLGSPLPVGTTGEAELMDVYLAGAMAPETVAQRLSPQLPPGVMIRAASDVHHAEPSLQSQLRAAEYRLTLRDEVSAEQAACAVAAFLALDSLPWEQQREKEVKRYDLRPLVERMEVLPGPPPVSLLMRLDARPGATGRPDQVAAALGLGAPLGVHRLALVLENPGQEDADAPDPRAPR